MFQRQTIIEAEAYQRAPPHRTKLPTRPERLNNRVKPNRRACAALAGKRTFVTDAMDDGNAQTAVVAQTNVRSVNGEQKAAFPRSRDDPVVVCPSLIDGMCAARECGVVQDFGARASGRPIMAGPIELGSTERCSSWKIAQSRLTP